MQCPCKGDRQLQALPLVSHLPAPYTFLQSVHSAYLHSKVSDLLSLSTSRRFLRSQGRSQMQLDTGSLGLFRQNPLPDEIMPYMLLRLFRRQVFCQIPQLRMLHLPLPRGSALVQSFLTHLQKTAFLLQAVSYLHSAPSDTYTLHKMQSQTDFLLWKCSIS